MKSQITLFLIAILTIGCNTENTHFKIPGSFKALELATKGRAFPNADMPADAFSKAYDYHVSHFVDGVVDFRDDREWEAMGPLNTTGRTLTMAFNPQNPRTIYAGSASGGLWRSYNEGEGISWEYVETGHPILGVSTIAFAPGDSTVMYIGTGEVYNYSDTGDDGAYRSTRGSYGFGILKSEDGGESWSKSLDWSYNQRHGIWMIKVSQDDPNIVTAATTEGIYRSYDAGGSWEQLSTTIMATDVEVDPNDSDRIIASYGNFGTSGKGIYYSEDGGQSWTQCSGLPTDFNGKILLSMFEQDANIIYASIGNGFGFNDGYTWLCKTEDFGKTWNVVNETDYSQWQGWFAHDLAVHPTNSNEVTLIGINIWKTFNGGQSIEQVSNGGVTLGTPQAGVADGGPFYSHSDHHFVGHHPTNPSVIYFANDGGIFKSKDGGFSFASANGGMQTTQFYHGFVVSPLDENFAMGGLQDNSTSIFRGNGDWQRAIGGDGSWAAVSPDDLNVAFGSWQNLNIQKSTDQGQSFLPINLPDNDDNPLFISPVAIAPSNGQKMYAAGRYIYSSNNEGISWAKVNPSPWPFSDPIFSLEIAPSDHNIAYFGTSPEDGQTTIYATQDGGQTFTVNETELPHRIVNDLSVDPSDPAIVYAVLSGFESNHVYKSIDYGLTWESIDNNLPDVPTNAIQVDPYDSDHLYVGNDIGVYFSENGGQSWDVLDLGVPKAMIAMDFGVSIKDHKIWIATHGNGTYRTDLASTPVSSSNEVFESSELAIYPNPASSRLTISANELEMSHVQIMNTSGKLVYSNTFNSDSPIQIEHLPEGTYILNALREGAKVGSAQFQKME